MTAVRQTEAPRKGDKRAARKTTEPTRAAKPAPPRKATSGETRVGGSTGSASQVAQVRLQADELKALHEVMRQLRLPSMSEALREGIRLLTREASEVAAAEGIRRFYGARPAPLPDGVIPATEEELAAADAAQW